MISPVLAIVANDLLRSLAGGLYGFNTLQGTYQRATASGAPTRHQDREQPYLSSATFVVVIQVDTTMFPSLN